MIGLTSTSRLLKALGDESRMRILALLAQEDLAGTDLMEILNMGQSRISTQLNLLKEVGLATPQQRRRAPHPARVALAVQQARGLARVPERFRLR